MLKNRSLKVSLVKNAKNEEGSDAIDQLTPEQYIAFAEDAVNRIGKKLVIGAVAIIATYAVLATLSAVTVNALDPAN